MVMGVKVFPQEPQAVYGFIPHSLQSIPLPLT